MGTVWFFLTTISLIILIFQSPSTALTAFSSAGSKAVTFSITMCGVYVVWLGFINLVTESGLINKLKKPLNPIINFLFGKQKDVAKEYLIQNISANLLGMGNACTPSGMRAMEELDDKSGIITYAMMMLLVLNSTSVQIIPTTTIGLRVAHGSADPASIVIPCLISSVCATIIGVTLVKLYWRRKIKKQERKT